MTTFGSFKSLPFLRRCMLPTSARSPLSPSLAVLGMEVVAPFFSAVSMLQSLTDGAKHIKPPSYFHSDPLT